MADSFLRQKKHYPTLTFTAILFLISFLLILLVLLSGERTLSLFLFPSLYRDLFLQTTPSPPSSSLRSQSLTPPILELESTSPTFNHTPEIESPISVEESTDVKINGGKGENGTGIFPVHENEHMGFISRSVGYNGLSKKEEEEGVKRPEKRCNLYMGKWVRDDGYPVYQPSSCPYVDEAYDCQSNGRPDFEYTKWRWKPDDCDLPRFNATDLLVRIRGKRLMLVGDSMNRNQFESMLCLLRDGLPDKSKMYEVHGYKITKGRGFYIFKFVDFNCTIEFVRSHFLVREGTRINGQGNSNPTLSIDKIDKTAGRWKRADILIFNTGHWWTHGKISRGKA